MEERRPLLSGEYAWSVSKKDGKMRMHIGPDAFELTDDDMLMVPDPLNTNVPVRLASDDDGPANPNRAIQKFVVIQPGQYAVIHSPVDSTTPKTTDHPNGSFSSGKNEAKPLHHGHKDVITDGFFPLWPGQSVELRPVHHLDSDDYIVVQVESPVVDIDAPYFDITEQCSGIRSVVVDDTVNTEGESATIQDEQDQENDVEPAKSRFLVGQRIIIPGSKTPTYIPPTGIEVLCDIQEQEARPDVVAKGTRARRLARAKVEKQYLDRSMNAASASMRADGVERYCSTGLPAESGAEMVAMPEDDPWLDVVRKAVVLGPTEFCVTLDKDGSPKPHKGPGRVFPGPDDRFRTEGSKDRIYAAYHMREDRGLLIRIVTDEIDSVQLAQQLPASVLGVRDGFTYHKGDELFLREVDAYLVPPSTIQVINPKTAKPHIGNDHSDIFVSTIGIDQKSGIYVENQKSGVVELVKGQKTVLLDPREARHQYRAVPIALWDLVIGHTEPHKNSDQAAVQKFISNGRVKTPWALSVQVPNNEAMLVVSRTGRRIVMGPCTELLDYEEIPEVLELSRGNPKKQENVTLQTCFLRVKGNRISDQVKLVTSDHVSVDVDVEYGVEFVGDNEEDAARWFEFKNYVWLLCTNLRSRLRGAAQQETLANLYDGLSEFVRGVVLGVKGEGDAHRPGLTFAENGMKVNEVEVLNFVLEDKSVASLMDKTNLGTVTRQIEDADRNSALASEQYRESIERERFKLDNEKHERHIEEIARTHQASSRQNELEHVLSMVNRKQVKELEEERCKVKKMVADSALEITRAQQEQHLSNTKEEYQILLDRNKQLTEMEQGLTASIADAESKKLKAITPKLVEALEGLGRRDLAAALAENLPEATGSLGYLLELGGMKAFKALVKGTAAEETLNDLFKNADNNGIPKKPSNEDD